MRNRLVPLGFLIVLLPPIVLVFGAKAGLPWLAFLIFVASSPITRALFGTYPSSPMVVSERLCNILYALPFNYLLVFLALLPLGAASLVSGALPSASDRIWFAASLWTVLTFGTFPAHEMIHRSSKTWIRLGSFLAGLCGYPILSIEHTVHHRSPGNVADAEWPRITESVWQFAPRRLVTAVRNAICNDNSLRHSGQWGSLTPLVFGSAGLLTAITAFGLIAGLIGILIYTCAALMVVFAMQVMTYVQHWGLGADSVDFANERELAWEDDCLMQAWLTMGNSFHHSHHVSSAEFYVFVRPSPIAPRQPGCYVVGLVSSMVPSLWRRMMIPVLANWKSDPNMVCQPGRRLICVVPSKINR
jgi:hypothetical protein